jgi:hypothetical protein
MVNTRIPSVPGPDADPALSDSATGNETPYKNNEKYFNYYI